MTNVSSSCADLDFLFSWSNSTGCPRVKSCDNMMATCEFCTMCTFCRFLFKVKMLQYRILLG